MALSKNWRVEITARGREAFPVKSLGQEVLVRPMTAARRMAIDESCRGEDGNLKSWGAYSLALVADSIVDDVGDPLFTVADLNGLEWPVVVELIDIVGKFLEVGKVKN